MRVRFDPVPKTLCLPGAIAEAVLVFDTSGFDLNGFELGGFYIVDTVGERYVVPPVASTDFLFPHNLFRPTDPIDKNGRWKQFAAWILDQFVTHRA